MPNNAGTIKKNQALPLKQSPRFTLPKNKTAKYAQIKVKNQKYAQNTKLLRIVRNTK
jgi:hypothetical protein